jgi:hypothetical protein
VQCRQWCRSRDSGYAVRLARAATVISMCVQARGLRDGFRLQNCPEPVYRSLSSVSCPIDARSCSVYGFLVFCLSVQVLFSCVVRCVCAMAVCPCFVRLSQLASSRRNGEPVAVHSHCSVREYRSSSSHISCLDRFLSGLSH